MADEVTDQNQPPLDLPKEEPKCSTEPEQVVSNNETEEPHHDEPTGEDSNDKPHHDEPTGEDINDEPHHDEPTGEDSNDEPHHDEPTGEDSNDVKQEVKEEKLPKEDQVEQLKKDHFSQNKPDEFSSENFKIEIGGLPKYYPLGHLKKLLNNTLQLDAHRVKPGGMGRNVAYVNFKDEESRFKAITVLTGYKWQGSILTADKADPAKDPILLAKIDYLKVPKKEYEMLPLEERIQKAVTPFHNLSYEEQLKEKEKVVRSVLRKFGNELAQMNPELKKFVHWHKIRRKGQVCELDDIAESPIKEGYRNKNEFTIGKNSSSDKPVVGFRVASYKDGSVEVGPVDHLRNLNEKMKLVVQLMEKYLETSPHAPFDPFSHEGIWRQLTVRTSNNDDVMLIVVIHPQELGGDEITAIKEGVKAFFVDGDGKEAGVTSIFFQQYGQKESGKEIEYEHIYGKTYIEETILGKTFKASPDAFLQVNTPACEVLYNKIAEVADVDPTSIILDVCCGVGTIGLSIAEAAYKMMGVELTPSAVENARANAEANGIANAVFYHGKAEDYIDTMIERSQRVNTIAIVDPPRAGLNGSVMNALRKCEYLDKLVYISCDPQAALPNFQALGRPRSKTYKGSYFVPIRASPVDLFPDTPHFELIIVFERYDECKWDRIISGNPRPKDQAYFDRVPELKYDIEQQQKDKEERDEKRRERQKDRRPYDRWRNDDGSWARGGNRGWRENSGRGGRRGNRREDWDNGGDWNREWRDDNYGRGSWRRDSGPWRGGGNNRDWNSDRSFNKRNVRQDYGEGGDYPTGFQEGFQAGLEALNNQFSGFGQGGGWNMAQTQAGYGQQENEGYNMNSNQSGYVSQGQGQCQGQVQGQPQTQAHVQSQGMGQAQVQPQGMGQGQKGNQGMAGTWGAYDGNSGNYINNQPVTYPASVTNPMQSATGYGYQNAGWNQQTNQSGNQGTNNAGGWGSANQYQGGYDDSNQYPAAKRWKSGDEMNMNTGNYDYSTY